ncbi:uncharacterized protein LOC121728990 [Aricia agestis]|uniref:uncharacterized protein LOC121728990 n=1 Tax=Aricia agestis TaxID=91739 RepID=UPI001C2039C7|nr:uncharacterized protein LOC121728990 [Aricia agestis]
MPGHLGFLQGNGNHSAAAQDLFLQSMAEWHVDVAVLAEPYCVPPQPHWAGDDQGSVAILVRPGAGPPLIPRMRGPGYVVAVWGEYAIIGVYFSPNRNLAALEQFLDALGPLIRRLAPLPVIVAGDFNAKSSAWGSPVTDPKGREVEEWALASGLSLLNTGAVPTCVRRTGGSVVDLSFATPAVARRVERWRVVTEVETLSDHRYIRFEVSSASASSPASRFGGRSEFPRWALSKLNRELAEEAAIVGCWSLPPSEGMGVDELAGCFGNVLTSICRAAMPRVRGRPPPRRAVYWWSTELADLRAACNAARRAYTRSRRRRPQDEERDGRLYRVYRAKREILQLAISRAKERAWLELVEGIDNDPWGRPYKRARDKLRAQSAPLTQTLQPQDSLLREWLH